MSVQLNRVSLVNASGKKVKQVSMLVLDGGESIVFSEKLSKKAALTTAIGLVAKALGKKTPRTTRKTRRPGRPRKVQSAE